MKKFMQLIPLGLVLVLIAPSIGFISTSRAGDSVEHKDKMPEVVKKNWSFNLVGLTPVQSGGRIKPLDSFAREIVLFETGSRSYQGWAPIDLLLSWTAYPQYWDAIQFIRIGRDDVRRQLGLDESRTFFSPQELFKNPSLAQYAERMGKGIQGSEPPGAPKTSPREQELRAVLDRLGLFHGLVTGQGWLLIPKPAPEAWTSLIEKEEDGNEIRSRFVDVLKSYQAADQNLFEASSASLRGAIEDKIPGYATHIKSAVAAETIYNRFRPFLFAWILYLASTLGWTFCLFIQKPKPLKKAKAAALVLTGLAAASQIAGIALRCFVAGRPPVTNMYESVIWVSFGVMLFASFLYYRQRQPVIFAVSCTMAMLGLIAGDAAPAILDPSIHPLVPVLRSNYWLTIHVLTITLGYAAFALTLGLANYTLFQFLKKEKSAKINVMNQLTYRAMQFGVVLIAAGTILGGIWADYSWGRFWGWDPKEVWALITLLCYLVILHGRYANWVGQFGFAAWSAVSFMSVVMAWYGVNFVLGVGLHSYGFSTGGTPWVVGFVSIQLAYVLFVTGKRYADRK
jgi:cytochrome c-type biogenesis protein CcsB